MANFQVPGRSFAGTNRWQLAARLALRDPELLVDYGRWYLGDRIGQPEPRRDIQAEVAPLSPAEGREQIADMVGPWTEGPGLSVVRSWSPSVAGAGNELLGQAMAGDFSLGELAYGLVRVLRPHTVIETGVAQGITSAYVAAALADNGFGVLHSIDLPPTALIAAGLVGAAVPRELRTRWRYHWGASRRLLPELLELSRGNLRLFIHDGDHSYANMRWEIESAWQALEPDGWIVADDVDGHTALADVAQAHGGRPLYLRQETKSGLTGLLRKPG